ncbi:PQQ-binding-like beta-propeller repeat protein [Streptomyces sp. NPDC059063]|uniref:outer membrane protein assembly factor BamB family protein n=1 Tax=Streptomyces sp. NPDC059063 TaxID=3346712 RepID=UPI0036B4DED2
MPPPPEGFGPPQAPPTGGGGGRRRAAAVVASVVALALAAAGGAWYVASSGDDEDGGGKGERKKPAAAKPQETVPKNPEATFHGGAPVPKLPKKESTWPVGGSWLTDKVYVKSSVSKVIGLDAGTGKKRWAFDKPGQSCAGSPEVGAGGIAVVVTAPTPHDDRGFRAPCTQITAFKVDTGDKLWTKSVTIGYQKDKAEFNQAAISGNTVAVGGIRGGAAFDLRTGALRWKPRAGAKCWDVGYGGGERLVAVRACGDIVRPSYRIQLLDPTSGKPRWSHRLPEGVRGPNVISTKPVVIGLDSGEISDSGASDVFSLDERGKLRARITLEDRRYLHDCDTASIVNDCIGIVVGNGRLYVPTARRDAPDGISSLNDIVVFSLATGKMTGQRVSSGAGGSPMFPLRMDGPNILAYRSRLGTQVLSLDGRTLKPTTLLTTKKSASAIPPLMSEVRYGHGRLYVSTDLVSKPYSKRPQPMMIVFARE